ncbi:MAG TPA: hypothetical protein VMU33_02405 [Burkholderiaceae bacterium]|nr:hypothetical protein [Burkholderiaceae bacterium]
MSSNRRTCPSSGFTLIDLSAALLALSIVSVFAVPRILQLGSDTRVSRVAALEESIKAASLVTHAAALAAQPPQTGASGTVVVDGTAVRTAYGYPDASEHGIVAAMGLDTGARGADAVALVSEPSSIRIEVADAWSRQQCGVGYRAATASALPAVSTSTTSGC